MSEPSPIAVESIDNGQVVFLQSPPRYSTDGATALLLDISRASTELDSTSCLITLRPFETGTVQICHVIDKETPEADLRNLRNWWGHNRFRVNSALNLIPLDSHFHDGFDKSPNPMWTIIPTDSVIEEILTFSMGAQVSSVKERKGMYDKYDVRLTGKPNTYRFVPLHMLIGGHHFYRQTKPIPDDHTIWDTDVAVKDRIDESTKFANENLIPIHHPFDHPYLQELHSHVHPFCVIVKAGQVLSTCDYLVPPSLHRAVQTVGFLSMKWRSAFPIKKLRAVGSKASPHSSPSDSRSCHSLHPAPYPATNPRLHFGTSARFALGSGGGTAGNAAAGKSADAGHQIDALPLCDSAGSPGSSDHESGNLDTTDALELIRKIKPWRQKISLPDAPPTVHSSASNRGKYSSIGRRFRSDKCVPTGKRLSIKDVSRKGRQKLNLQRRDP